MLNIPTKEQPKEQLKQETKIESVDEKIDTEDIAVEDEKKQEEIVEESIETEKIEKKETKSKSTDKPSSSVSNVPKQETQKNKRVVAIQMLLLHHNNLHKVNNKTHNQVLMHRVILLDKRIKYQLHFMIQ